MQVVCRGLPPVTVPTMTYECTGLEPMQEYAISVTAVNGAGEGLSATMTTSTACQGTYPYCNLCTVDIKMCVPRFQNAVVVE